MSSKKEENKTICEQIHDPKRIYKQTMGFKANSSDDCTDKCKRKRALNRAHETRRFEIELYWKRANYFWLLQAAVFTAFGLLVTTEDKAKNIPEVLPLALTCLGFLCAYAGYLSAEGSKFWQENWEKHIDILEDSIEGKLYKTVWVSSHGIKHSVSRINSILILYFCAFWVLTIVVLCISLFCKYEFEYHQLKNYFSQPIIASFLIFFTALASRTLALQTSDFEGQFKEVRVEIKNEVPITSKNGWIKRN